ncbi:CRISPR-associated helicase Cas3' [Sulfurovum mangrovi]|uniref:CRISPR-associated helicase Cas3' n=1 Tax=Sulfurovum mangrovi TaxID=2893889 RepID=UPI001E4A88A5|nr:CRISPR-associated helicase Cas3' [Sulfurovum mangrovi]UFH60010.1 CRISPR-associated helicase Cas3' [Sulfurovum mangrovi]
MKYKSHPNINLSSHCYRIYQSFPQDQEHRIVSFFHDIGKISQEFQDYINKKSNKKTTHAFESSFFYFFMRHDKEKFEDFLANLYAINKHHGNLPDIEQDISSNFNFTLDGFKKHYFMNFSQKSVKKIHEKLFLMAKPVLRELTQERINKELMEFLFFYKNILEHKKYEFDTIEEYFLFKIRFSKLIFADKYEAIFNQAYKQEKTFKASKYIDRLESIIQEKGKNQNNLNDKRNQARLEILANYQKDKDKKIFIIEAPTGIGKTFAALHLSLQIAKDFDKQTIITALPFTSIIDQTYTDYYDIFEFDQDNILLKYHHLTDSKNCIEPDTENAQVLQKNDYITATWAFDNVIVTTFNQFLYTIFSNKNSDLLKFWKLQNSVVILDEIQSIPRVLLEDVAITLSFLAEQYNVHFILMSATIPAIQQFFNQESFAQLLSTEYYTENNRYTIVPQLDMKYELSDDEQSLLEQIENKSKNQSVLCVVNTKKFAKKIYDDLKTNGVENLYLLSTHLIPKHRKQKIEEIKKKLGDINVVLISTQMVEAGVDLDFDIGFRELAPYGSIIQTAGRINRNNQKEAGQDNKDCTLIVFSIKPHPIYKNGKSHPYHEKDMLIDEQDEFLGNEIKESEILEKVNNYFQEVMDRTISLHLYEKMKKLEFQSVVEEFEKNFMQKIPNLVPVFVETKPNLAQCYREKKFALLREARATTELSKKMEIKSKLKKLEKRMSKYIIDVKKEETTQLEKMFNTKEFQDFTNIHICPFDNYTKRYSYEIGWNGEYWDYGFD